MNIISTLAETMLNLHKPKAQNQSELSRLMHIEYKTDYHHFLKSVGRPPTEKEVVSFLDNY